MTRRPKQAPAPVQLKPPVKVRELTPAERAEAARNVAALRKQNASWKLGDQRDAENLCKQCGADRVEVLKNVAPPGEPKEQRVWDVRCLACRPMVH